MKTSGRKAYIFMNQHIKLKTKGEPVITIYSKGTRRLHVNRLRINGPSEIDTDGRGLKIVTTHHVTAWIECNRKDIQVLG
jgi:hypothetical protein